MTIELSECVIDEIANAIVKKIQESKTGHWNKHGRSEAYTCSECEYWVGVKYNYCPSCGSKMEV